MEGSDSAEWLIEKQTKLQTYKFKVVHAEKDDPNFIHRVTDLETITWEWDFEVTIYASVNTST